LAYKVDTKSNFGNFEAKKAPWFPNLKGRACNLDFPALHESNFAAHFTGCQLFGPAKSFKVDF